MPCRTSKSSTLLHHQVHSFMAHGVDPLVEIGGQHLAPHGDMCSIFLWEGEHTRTSESTKQSAHQYPT
jgi:hypothetical protein